MEDYEPDPDYARDLAIEAETDWDAVRRAGRFVSLAELEGRA